MERTQELDRKLLTAQRQLHASLDDKDEKSLDELWKLIATEEIGRMTGEINRLLETENEDRDTISKLIIKCAQLKYSAIATI